jgi:DNA processing protein
VQLKHDDIAYPQALHALPNPPRVLTTSGPLSARRAVAIVGSRRATNESMAFAHELAFQLAAAGVVVVSGGATGVDAAAHKGALDAGGATWVVSPTGKNRLYPPEHRDLFDAVARAADSRMIWPFPDDQGVTNDTFLYRNGVLAALSETLVVVQAHYQSGSRNAASWARDLGRPVWAMTAAPWMTSFCGSSSEIELGRARPLCTTRQLLRALGLGEPVEAPQLPLPFEKSGRARASARISAAPPRPPDTTSWSADEKIVFSSLWADPMHMDQIVEATGLAVPPISTALLTLALKDVVVEGPNGFFRRRTAP